MQKVALILAMTIIPLTSTPASAQNTGIGDIFRGIGTIVEGIEQLQENSELSLNKINRLGDIL